MDLEPLAYDLWHAARALARRPLMALVIVSSLALVMGCNTAVFSFLDYLLWQRLPAREPDRLVEVSLVTQKGVDAASYPDYQVLRERTRQGLEDLAAWAVSSAGVYTGERTVHAWTTLAAGNFFQVLGADALWGRALGPDDDRPGAVPAVVLGYGFWERELGGDRRAIGRTLRINDHPFLVVGVMSDRFLSAGLPTEIYVPLAQAALVRGGGPELLTDRGRSWLSLLGRLAPGLTTRQAGAALTIAAGEVRAEVPDLQLRDLKLAPGGMVMGPEARASMLPMAQKLMLFVSCLLLIVCANVANLLLANAVDRSADMGVRSALGARRGRLVRQLLAEGLLLALLGGALGSVLALWETRIIETYLMASNSGVGRWADGLFRLRLDLRVLAFTFLMALGAGALAGALPGLRVTARENLASLLKGTPSGTPPSRVGVRELLVVFQVALSVALLAATGLFARGLWSIYRMQPGFETERLLLVALAAPGQGKGARAVQRNAYQDLVEGVRSLPGVTDSSLVEVPPLSGYLRDTEMALPGHPDAKSRVSLSVIGADFFRTLGIPLLQGRVPGPGDVETTPRVAVVNQALAQKIWPGESPIGRRVLLEDPRDGMVETEVVGLVPDTRSASLWKAAEPLVYIPFAQSFRRSMTLVARTAGPAARLAQPVRQEIERRQRDFAVVDLVTFPEHLAHSLWLQRLGTEVVSIFGVLGLALAALGVWSSMSFAVSRRVRDIGIRIAIGARRDDVLRDVLFRALRLVGAGAALGCGLLLAAVQIVSSFVEGVETRPEPWTLGLAALLLLAVGAAASVQPALRAARVDPLTALKHS